MLLPINNPKLNELEKRLNALCNEYGRVYREYLRYASITNLHERVSKRAQLQEQLARLEQNEAALNHDIEKFRLD